MPEYLSFVKGIVDSEDLPLNISREVLQQNRIMSVIRKSLVKKCIELFGEIMDDDERSVEFYKNFGKNLKLGVHEDSSNRTKLAKLLRFNTTTSGEDLVSLDTYIENMKEGQEKIYYIAGESLESVRSSPCLEQLAANNLEVLFFVDPIDEYMTQQMKDYEGKTFVCITKENLDIAQTDEEKTAFEETSKSMEKVCAHIKDILSGQVEKVVVSKRLSGSPCTLVTGEYGWSANMERILKAQALRDSSMDMMMGSKKTMEINPNNRIIKKVQELLS
jgi:molecular chaperone HtpG